MEANQQREEIALTAPRRLFRIFMRGVLRGFMRIGARVQMEGLERVPAEGPLVVTVNHLGYLDAFVLAGTFPRQLDTVMAAEMLEIPFVRQIVSWYGMVPVKRGQFDRQVLTRSVALLKQGRAVGISPEAGVSETAALRQARDGAAYLALQTGAQILPVAVTGTESVQGIWDSAREKLIFKGMEPFKFWRLRRPKLDIGLIYGNPFDVAGMGQTWREKRQAMQDATDEIMRQIAALLPSRYQGIYQPK
jgi:1-acyl-sn-glycerol-3-phosphate acyltransferase